MKTQLHIGSRAAAAAAAAPDPWHRDFGSTMDDTDACTLRATRSCVDSSKNIAPPNPRSRPHPCGWRNHRPEGPNGHFEAWLPLGERLTLPFALAEARGWVPSRFSANNGLDELGLLHGSQTHVGRYMNAFRACMSAFFCVWCARVGDAEFVYGECFGRRDYDEYATCCSRRDMIAIRPHAACVERGNQSATFFSNLISPYEVTARSCIAPLL